MTRQNIAVWGIGRHAQNRILPAINASSFMELIGVCSRNITVVSQCSDTWDCIGWTNPDEMLSNPEVNIVYISTPIGIHYSMVKKTLNSGKHVWCEKPLTCNYDHTKELISLSKRKNRVLIEAFMYLHHPQFKRVLNFVNETKNVTSIICRFGIPKLEKPGFRNKLNLCGGAFWDIASYNTSLILSLFPNQKIEVIFAEINKDNTGLDVNGRSLLRTSKGVTAYLEWSSGVAYKNEIDIWSEEGSFFTEKIFSKPKNYKPIYYLRDKNGNQSIEHEGEYEQFEEMINKFVKLMLNESKIAIERKKIVDRAKLMKAIDNFCKN